MKLRLFCFFLLCATLATSPLWATESTEVQWQNLAPGMGLAKVPIQQSPSSGKANLTILRMDPELWELEVLTMSKTGDEAGHTAKEWSRQYGFSAAINAGMFATDYTTNVGYLRSGDHVNNGRFNKYKSVAAFGRKAADQPHFRIFDLDAPGVSTDGILKSYSSLIQNLRLIKRPGENRWSQQAKRWSEAALGEDKAGRILFIFCPVPFSMHDLNRRLLALEIDLVAAQHLEGGSKAQLYIAVGDHEIQLAGRFEGLIQENNTSPPAWRVPNILGVRPRSDRDSPSP